MTPAPMAPEHRAFVASTWARGQRYGLRTRQAFRFVNHVLDTGVSVVVIANGPTVHAWACGEDENTLHYAYVPPGLRREGFAHRLLDALFGAYPEHINVTHPWPFESSRFRYVPNLLLRAAA